MSKPLATPVLLIGFNRPHLTSQVIASLSCVKPKDIYFAVDGPRNISDIPLITQVKDLTRKFTWKCRVHTKFAPKNLGCKMGPVAAMDWFFSHVDRGIIIEDDVVAHPSFFYFCQELLNKYRYDQRIGSISGNNFQFGRNNCQDSFYFSRYSHSCGWATWKRAWKLYDLNLKQWQLISRSSFLATVFSSSLDRLYWWIIFDAVFKGIIDTAWDYQWNYAMWTNHMLGIIPSHNLIYNIGFGDLQATHTKYPSKFSQIPVIPMPSPLQYPNYVYQCQSADNYTQANNYILWKLVAMVLLLRIRRIFRM